MKKIRKNIKNIILFCLLILVIISINIFSVKDKKMDYHAEEEKIQLIGETHGYKEFYNKELEIWQDNYKDGCRHLFVETSYFTAEYLNLWMHEENDVKLDEIYSDLEGTLSHTPVYYDFLKKIKENEPETIFHGTDIGHCYFSTGERYKKYLEDNHLEDTINYQKTITSIDQGIYYYESDDSRNGTWRENKMVENFITEYQSVSENKIVGIYGADHVNVRNKNCMAGILRSRLGDIISNHYIYTELMYPKAFRFGFSYIGLIFVILITLPKVMFLIIRKSDEEFGLSKKNIYSFLSLIMMLLCSVTAIIFKDFNLVFYIADTSFLISYRIGYLLLAIIMMILYIFYSIKLFRSHNDKQVNPNILKKQFPVLIFFLIGLYGANWLMIGLSLLYGLSIVLNFYYYKKSLV